MKILEDNTSSALFLSCESYLLLLRSGISVSFNGTNEDCEVTIFVLF
jgi:hypothetical protein